MTQPNDHLIGYVTRADAQIVVDRVPPLLRERLREIYLSRASLGVTRLGSVRRRGRRDVTLYSVLPPRVSLRRFIHPGQSASEFGAPARGQWPPWAVRRFLLYDVLLHEIGHLQIVDPTSASWTRKYAAETLAQAFANDLRRELWGIRFDHPDPIHNPPGDDELAALDVWQTLDKDGRARLVEVVLSRRTAPSHVRAMFGRLGPAAERFLERVLAHGISNRNVSVY